MPRWFTTEPGCTQKNRREQRSGCRPTARGTGAADRRDHHCATKGGFLGILVENGNFKLSFYDAKKKPAQVDVARATARWPVKYKLGMSAPC